LSPLRALPYVPVEELGDRPHVLVDGATRPGSVLTLSHWPQSPTPMVLARDLSAEIVFAFLHAEEPTRPRPSRSDRRALAEALRAGWEASAVTNDHFDEDGAVSVFALVDPEAALQREPLLVDVASCGDFGVVRSRAAARIAFAIGPVGEEGAAAELGPSSPPWVDAERPGSWSGARYRAVLERFVDLVDHPDRYRTYWEGDDAALEAGAAALRSGAVTIEEVAGLDLAIVRRVTGTSPASTAPGAVPIHAVALHSATAATRILAFDGDLCECYLRYEGWVRYVSRPVARRPDLAPLAARLSEMDPSGASWRADGVGSIVTRLVPAGDGRTGLDPAVVTETVIAYLWTAPAAWDPFRPGGSLVPSNERAGT